MNTLYTNAIHAVTQLKLDKNVYFVNTDFVFFKKTTMSDTVVALKAKETKVALLKALSQMMSLNVSANCLTACAVAAKVLRHYGIPFEPVAGYTQLYETKKSFAHVWLETNDEALLAGGTEPLITDLTFSGTLRSAFILGQAFSFDEEARNPMFSLEPLFEEVQGGLPFSVLQTQAGNLDAYMDRAPESLRKKVQDLIAKATDGDPRIEFQGVSSSIVENLIRDSPEK
jgi:hypothetical protein